MLRRSSPAAKTGVVSELADMKFADDHAVPELAFSWCRKERREPPRATRPKIDMEAPDWYRRQNANQAR